MKRDPLPCNVPTRLGPNHRQPTNSFRDRESYSATVLAMEYSASRK